MDDLFLRFSVQNMYRYLMIAVNDDQLEIVLEGDNSEKYGFVVSDQDIITYSRSTSAYTFISESYTIDKNGTLQKLVGLESYCIEKNGEGVYQLSSERTGEMGVINVCKIQDEKYFFTIVKMRLNRIKIKSFRIYVAMENILVMTVLMNFTSKR